MINFPFNSHKSIEAMAVIAERLRHVDKAKLMKLLYLADREHFLKHGHPISGGRLVAMKWGPVPSPALDVLNGTGDSNPNEVYTYLRVYNSKVAIAKRPAFDSLDRHELQTLSEVVEQHGHKEVWSLCRETHELPEYKKRYVKGTAKSIFYEDILEAAGGNHFRHGRPVVNVAMMSHMTSPFSSSDEDL